MKSDVERHMKHILSIGEKKPYTVLIKQSKLNDTNEELTEKDKNRLKLAKNYRNGNESFLPLVLFC